MRAIEVEHRNELGTLKELPDPVPGAHEILVRISVAGVNPIDWKSRDVYGRPLPFILGQDFAGIVVGTGDRVQRYKHGERVFGIAREHGAYADRTVVPEDDNAQPVAHIPDEVGDADAAGLPTAGLTALAGVERLGVKSGQLLMIVGITGALGQFAAQIARDRGIRVAGSGRAENAQIAQALSVETYAAYDQGDVVEAMRAKYPDGVDAVLDVADDADALVRTAGMLKRGGWIASTIRSVEPERLKPLGVNGLNVNLFESPQASHEGLRTLAQMVEGERLRVPIVAERNLTDAVAALELQKSGKINGKILLTI